MSPDVKTTRSRGFLRREGARRRSRGQRETTPMSALMQERERRGRGPRPWRTPPTTMIYTAPLPPDRVLLLLTPTTTPRSAMGYMEAAAESIMERDIDCIEHITDVTC